MALQLASETTTSFANCVLSLGVSFLKFILVVFVASTSIGTIPKFDELVWLHDWCKVGLSCSPEIS